MARRLSFLGPCQANDQQWSTTVCLHVSVSQHAAALSLCFACLPPGISEGVIFLNSVQPARFMISPGSLDNSTEDSRWYRNGVETMHRGGSKNALLDDDLLLGLFSCLRFIGRRILGQGGFIRDSGRFRCRSLGNEGLK